MSTHFYLDESGDLGWKFDKPYRFGGSSRCLTIGVLQVSGRHAHLPMRLIKKLYKKYRWNSKKEMKWSQMKPHQRKFFALRASQLAEQHTDIQYWAIVVNKQKVQPHIREDPNKLYNYMIKLLLCKEMARHTQVRFVPDPRSIKVESGDSLHDYLQSELWFERDAKTLLTTCPCDSSANKNVQFADMLSGAVQHCFEDDVKQAYRPLKKHLSIKTLYFL